ncbi:MAG: CDP-glucose 4,6-dehydratase [Hyphomicrobiales bacterium]|nr:CDP-glucose 4,6-dehydratase [Hyphomicrobiales bacterium]
MTPDFWRGRRVFLTGHTGFKGAWLTLWLHAMGAEVYGYALDAPTTPSLWDLADVGAVCRDHRGDVRDLEAVTAAMQAFDPQIVFHLAAQSLVRPSYAAPVETYATNVMGTIHVLEAARRCAVLRAVVVVTSDKCYENREWVWGYREIDPLGGHDPYSSSKGAAEIVTHAYAASFFGAADGPLVATARAGNVIGGGDWAIDRLVPDIVAAFREDRAPEIRSPDSVRPWQHVLEPLSGYLDLAEALVTRGRDVAGAWNFGPPPEAVRSVREIADAMAALWGEGRTWRDASRADAPHEATLLQLDSAKARTRLGWTSRWRFDEALAATVDWYRALDAGASARALCEAQIAAHSRRG